MNREKIYYEDIKIKCPYDILELHRLKITAEPNEHLRLKYTGMVSEEKKDEYVGQSKFKDKIEVLQLKNGKEIRTLFSGQPVNIDINVNNGRYYITVEALSYTYNLDIEKKKRSFQDKSMSYDGLIKSNVKRSQSSKSDYILQI